jgi:hypothetical protein
MQDEPNKPIAETATDKTNEKKPVKVANGIGLETPIGALFTESRIPYDCGMTKNRLYYMRFLSPPAEKTPASTTIAQSNNDNKTTETNSDSLKLTD